MIKGRLLELLSSPHPICELFFQVYCDWARWFPRSSGGQPARGSWRRSRRTSARCSFRTIFGQYYYPEWGDLQCRGLRSWFLFHHPVSAALLTFLSATNSHRLWYGCPPWKKMQFVSVQTKNGCSTDSGYKTFIFRMYYIVPTSLATSAWNKIEFLTKTQTTSYETYLLEVEESPVRFKEFE